MYTIAQLAQWMRCYRDIDTDIGSRQVKRIIHDSREVREGDVFLALESDTNDGHAYIEDSLDAGAVAVIASAQKTMQFSSQIAARIIAVDDPLAALQGAARAYRREADFEVIGITGSAGKTTTKQLVRDMVARVKNVAASPGNWNNHIGVPLSILAMPESTDVAVIEMGANHVGEIAQLSRIAEPDIAILTTIGYSHVGLFGGLDKTTQAKFEITQGMDSSRGALILNGDSERITGYARNIAGFEKTWFGFSRGCSMRAVDYTYNDDLHCFFEVEGGRYEMPVVGKHYVYNALAAIAVGMRYGLSYDTMAGVIAGFSPDAMRGRIVSKDRVRYVCDYYNANPESMNYALEMLNVLEPLPQKRVCVLGSMYELGDLSTQLHMNLGEQVAEHGVRLLVTVGEDARAIADAAVKKGLGEDQVYSAGDADEAARYVRQQIKEGDTVLIKASRALALERVYQAM